MKFIKSQIWRNHWPKILSLFFFVVLFTAYVSTFAVFTPGQTLDPNCAPGTAGCTVSSGSAIPDQTGNSGKFLTTDGTGNLSWNTITGSSPWLTSGSDTYYSAGNVGIGTSTPIYKLDLHSSINNGFIANFELNDNTGSENIKLSNTNTGIESIAGIYMNAGGLNGMEITTVGNIAKDFQGYGNVGYNSINSYMPLEIAAVDDIRFVTSGQNRININSSGNLGIGTTSPTAYLNIKAGSATAGTAPLKFTAGTNLGTTEAGAVEFDGAHLYFTATNGGTRYQLDQQSAGSLTLTTTGSSGAATWDGTTLNIPQYVAGTGLSSDAGLNTKGGTSAGLNLVAGAQYNTLLGYEAGKGGVVTTTMDYNTAVGYDSLAAITTGSLNASFGSNSLLSNTSGSLNTAIGSDSLRLNTSGTDNTAVGHQSLYNNSTGAANTAIGRDSLVSNTTGTYNLVGGWASSQANTTGSYNVVLGAQAFSSNKVGSRATVVGYNAMYYANNTNTPFDSNSVAVGYEALKGSTSSLNNTGTANSALGYQTLFSNSSGYNNTAVGWQALYYNTTGGNNTALGSNSLGANTSGGFNTSLGIEALYENLTTSNNTAVGWRAGRYYSSSLIANQAPSNSVYLGYDTRAGSASDTNEIVIGANAIGNGSNTATIGNSSVLRTYITGLNLKAGSATAGTAPLKFTAGTLLGTTEAGAVEYDGTHLYFTAINGGSRYQLDQQAPGSLSLTTTGSSGAATLVGSVLNIPQYTAGTGLSSNSDFNTLGGTSAGLNLVSGAQGNTFIGYQAGKSGAGTTNTADFNVGIGYYSFYSNTTGINNSAQGSYSLFSNTTGSQNSAQGSDSLHFNTTGSNNSAQGYLSLYSNTTGTYNSVQGVNSLGYNTTGSSNSALGYNAGAYISGAVTHLTAPTLSVFLGAGTMALADGDTNEIVIGASAVGNGSNTTTLGTANVLYVGGSGIGANSKVARFTNASGYCDINPVAGSISCTSDMNLKKNITTLDGKEFALQTIPVPAISQTTLDKIMEITPVNYNWNAERDSDAKHIGFIAQEMEQIFPSIVSTDEKTGIKSISYASVTPYLVKGIQEMNLQIKDLSSLDTTKATSLGSLIKNFLADVGNGLEKIFVKEVDTKNLCVSDESGAKTCLSKVQLDELLAKAGGVINIQSNMNTQQNSSTSLTIDQQLTKAKTDVSIPTIDGYTEASWSLFVPAKESAMALPETNDEEKTIKIAALNDAIKVLAPKENVVTTSNTTQVDLSAYNEVLNRAVITNYTTESWNAYQSVVAANSTTEANTQEEIDKATSDILAAQGNLVKIVVEQNNL